MYHGYRMTTRRRSLKLRRGYIIPATTKEDAGGIDCWVKMPNDQRILPVQVTQRGIRLYRKFQKSIDDQSAEEERVQEEQLHTFIRRSNHRIITKQRRCFKHGIAFALVRDFDGRTTNSTIAWGDLKALKYAIAHLKRRL